MARVDIIIPTYNRAAVLPETLKSVQQQSFADWRCFVAEDGQTADTAAAVAPFLEDQRFVYLPGEHRGTPAAPRNRAIRQGAAPFIAFLDDDDLWLPEKLKRQIEFMDQRPACVLLGANAFAWNGTNSVDAGLPLFFQPPLAAAVSFEALAAANTIINSTAMVRRPALARSGLLNEAAELASCEDYELWLRLAALGEVCILDAPLAIYRDAPQQGIRASHTTRRIYQKLACVYRLALRGDGSVPSPLARPENKKKAYLCRNLADFYRYNAGSLLGWRRLYFRIAAEARNVLLKFH